MDSKDDSGFDSDQKSGSNSSFLSQVDDEDINSKPGNPSADRSASKMKSARRTSDLQKKIEKQREKSRRKQVVEEQPKRSFMLPRSRLSIPSKQTNIAPIDNDQQPLVAIVSDDSDEDEFAVPSLTKEAQREITEQLIKDGYDLDLEPDDEDLDLIPPRPFHEREFHVANRRPEFDGLVQYSCNYSLQV